LDDTLSLHQFTKAVVVMGVSSCGKTTIGEALARHLGVAFVEGDKLHGPDNVAKMSAGMPLTDEDRWPWLQRVGDALRSDKGHVASCSALKRVYRDTIRQHAGRPVSFIHLHGVVDVLSQRMANRQGHFMPASLLDSQLATLEMPGFDENAITIDIDQATADTVKAALAFLTRNNA
jgi:gluconokinase